MRRRSSLYSAVTGGVVLDVGSAYTKCGFTGEPCPRHIFPTNFYIEGQKCAIPDLPSRVGFSLSALVVVVSTFLRSIYFRRLQVTPKDWRVIVCEDSMWPYLFKKALAQALFDLEIPGVVFLPTLWLPIYLTQETSGLVIDCGFSESRVIPICDGFPLQTSLVTVPVGMRDIHARLLWLLFPSLDTSAPPISLPSSTGSGKVYSVYYKYQNTIHNSLHSSPVDDRNDSDQNTKERAVGKDMSRSIYDTSSHGNPHRASDIGFFLALMSKIIRHRSNKVSAHLPSPSSSPCRLPCLYLLEELEDAVAQLCFILDRQTSLTYACAGTGHSEGSADSGRAREKRVREKLKIFLANDEDSPTQLDHGTDPSSSSRERKQKSDPGYSTGPLSHLLHHVQMSDTSSDSKDTKNDDIEGDGVNDDASVHFQFQAGEALFGANEEGSSIAEMVCECLLKCPLEVRAKVAANVVVSGGTASVPGFTRRLLEEIYALMEEKDRYSTLRGLKHKLCPWGWQQQLRGQINSRDTTTRSGDEAPGGGLSLASSTSSFASAALSLPPHVLAWAGASLVGSMDVLVNEFIRPQDLDYLGNPSDTKPSAARTSSSSPFLSSSSHASYNRGGAATGSTGPGELASVPDSVEAVSLRQGVEGMERKERDRRAMLRHTGGIPDWTAPGAYPFINRPRQR